MVDDIHAYTDRVSPFFINRLAPLVPEFWSGFLWTYTTALFFLVEPDRHADHWATFALFNLDAPYREASAVETVHGSCENASLLIKAITNIDIHIGEDHIGVFLVNNFVFVAR